MFDRLAQVVITIGGIAVILSIIGIFIFLVKEVAPLFFFPTPMMARLIPVTIEFTAGFEAGARHITPTDTLGSPKSRSFVWPISRRSKAYSPPP